MIFQCIVLLTSFSKLLVFRSTVVLEVTKHISVTMLPLQNVELIRMTTVSLIHLLPAVTVHPPLFQVQLTDVTHPIRDKGTTV